MHGSVSMRHSFYKKSQIPFFPLLFYMSQGGGFLVFLSTAVGNGFLNFNKSKGRIPFWFIFIQATLLTLAWVFNRGFLASRIGSFLLPFYCIVIADALSHVDVIAVKRILLGILVAGLIWNIPKSMGNQAGYEEAANFIASHNPDRILIGVGLIAPLLYYMGILGKLGGI